MSDDPEVARNRAEQAARIAATKPWPPEIELKLKRFWTWNGDLPAPEFTHWTKRGVFTIRAYTPHKVCSVMFDGTHLGYDDYFPARAAFHLFNGSYDRELGFKASDWVPSSIAGWNDLGG